MKDSLLASYWEVHFTVGHKFALYTCASLKSVLGYRILCSENMPTFRTHGRHHHAMH